MKRSVKAYWVVELTMLLLLGAASTAAYHFKRVAEEERFRRGELELYRAEQVATPVMLAPTDPTDQSNRSDQGDAELIAELRDQILELEHVISERDASIDSLRASQTNITLVSTNRWESRRDWLDRIKEEDPERYQEILKQREESRQRMREGFAKKAAHFLDRDKSSMSEDEAAEYQHMLTLLDRTWSLAEQLRGDIPREDRRPLMHEMRDNIVELTPMLDAQRDREFYEIGLDFGYAEDEAVQFVEYLNGIVDVTSMRSFFENMHRGPPPESR
ncbi:MAG: hypothetical protein KJ626_09250 [Verrucomicrobia bacterium]|nr:hypothetical protein [Verrucomicrobiota bacterium]